MKTEVKKKNKASLALYIVAVLFGIYAIFSLINSSLYISNLISTQYITVSESLTDIIVYFVTNCGPYIFYAAALGGLGYLAEAAGRSRKAETAEEDGPSVEMAEEQPEALPDTVQADAVETELEEIKASEAETVLEEDTQKNDAEDAVPAETQDSQETAADEEEKPESPEIEKAV